MSKEITMSIYQFMEMERGNISLEQIIKENNLDNIVGKILNNNKLRRFTVTCIALINLYTMPALAVSSQTTEPIITSPNILYKIPLKNIVYITCIMGFIIEAIKILIDKDKSNFDIPKVMIKYILIYASVFLIGGKD